MTKSEEGEMEKSRNALQRNRCTPTHARAPSPRPKGYRVPDNETSGTSGERTTPEARKAEPAQRMLDSRVVTDLPRDAIDDEDGPDGFICDAEGAKRL